MNKREFLKMGVAAGVALALPDLDRGVARSATTGQIIPRKDVHDAFVQLYLTYVSGFLAGSNHTYDENGERIIEANERFCRTIEAEIYEGIPDGSAYDWRQSLMGLYGSVAFHTETKVPFNFCPPLSEAINKILDKAGV
jgi:hypothetical protein